MLKRIIPFLILSVICFFAKGQDEAVHTQYIINPAWINPGYTGFNENHNIFANYRSHWSSFEGAPRNYSIQYHGAVTDRIGLGASFRNESLGATDRFRAQLAYSYRFGQPEDWKMGIGLTTAYESYKLNGSIVGDPNVDPTDPGIQEAINGINHFNIDFGFYGEYQETFIFGVSAPDMIRTRVDEASVGNTETEFFKYFTTLLGYRFALAGYDIKMEPSILMKKVRSVDFQFDFNFKMMFLDDQLVGGVTYSTGTGDRLGFLIGTQLDKFRFYYSYDVSFQQFQDYTNGSHDITIAIVLPASAN